MSPKPAPPEFGHHVTYQSSPPLTHPKAPISEPNALGGSGSGNVVGSSRQPTTYTDTGNKKHNLRPRLSHQYRSAGKTKRKQTLRIIDCLDGSVDDGSPRRTSSGEDDKGGGDDDDEYQLPESESDHDDNSIIKGFRNHQRKTTTSKTTSSSRSKPKGKQTAKAKCPAKATSSTAKHMTDPSTNQTTGASQELPEVESQPLLDVIPPVCEKVKPSAETSQPGIKDIVIPDSQDVVNNSQKTAIPAQSKPKATLSRRPKPSFGSTSQGSRQTNTAPVVSLDSIQESVQKATVRQEGTQCHTSGRMDPPPTVGITTKDLTKHNTYHTHQSQTTQHEEDNSAGATIEHGNYPANEQIKLLTTTCTIHSSPIVKPCGQAFDDPNYQELWSPTSPSENESEVNRRPSSKHQELVGNKQQEITSIPVGSQNSYTATQIRLPSLHLSPVQYDHAADSKDGSTQTTKSLEHRSSLRNRYWVSPEGRPVADEVPRHVSITSSPIADVGGPSPADPFTATPLHPASIRWARGISKKARQNRLKASEPQNKLEDTETLDQKSEVIQPLYKEPISKREIALGTHRRAIFDSIQEITTATLEHLKMKELAVDRIVEIYEQNGRQILKTVLERQAGELGQTVNNFNGRCIKLEKVFGEAARHTEEAQQRHLRRTDRYFQEYAQQREELQNAIKSAKDVLASL
ncbi:hypothetical protein F4808DRAFT_470629 [Astrocystis sublimbata]|nr:hypothetical protein F4808DRAFT_470629 [Astrocystis sublimbata]